MRRTHESSNRTSGLLRTHSADDPLTRALAPPEGETPEETEARIHEERAATKVSEDIDRDLRMEMQAARRRRCVKILLLGQSESGKSTVLKNFQRKYDPTSFDRERAVWRSVCQLNVVRSIGMILDVMNRVFEEQDRGLHPPHREQHHTQQLTPPTSPRAEYVNRDDNPYERTRRPSRAHAPSPSTALTAEHRRLTMRLAPLRQIEQALTRRFKIAAPSTPRTPPLSPPHSPAQELHVSGYAWQRARARGGRRGSLEEEGIRGGSENEDEELGRVLAACQADMVALWGDKDVRAILKETRVEEELNGFFLDDLTRIAVPHYAPTDDDVLRARLKTIGVTEHQFTIRSRRIETETLSAAEFRIYDVGGSRNQRAAWMPFFDDVNAIVFLAPMSAFDQTLVEAPEINRLEDTFGLWKNICASPLLKKVSLVLLLNKRDVLEHKLTSGIQFKRYVKSYTGKNDLEPVAKYLKTKFKAVQRELSPTPRMFYAHITCATDTKQMSMILAAIEDLVLRKNLEHINLL